MLPLNARIACLLGLVSVGCGTADGGAMDGGTADGGSARSIGIHAEICDRMCDDRSPGGRAPGDFTGLGCASEARIRLYQPGAGLVGAAPMVERCVPFGATISLADLFVVSAGLQGASPTQGAPVVLPSLATLGPVIAEVALYAPGGEACPADAPFLALGRSSVTDLAALATTSLSIPLGCHASCATSQARTLALRIETLDTGADQLAALDDLSVGELFSYGSLIETAGSCSQPPELETTPLGFRPYLTTRSGTSFAARYGIDASDFGGCIAVRGRRAGVTSYACLDGAAAASPLGLVVPEAQRATISALRSATDTPPTHGTLIVQTVDAAGVPVDGTTVVGPDAPPLMVGAGWDVASFSPFTQFRGMAIFPDALPGQYLGRVVGAGGVDGITFLGGAEPGTITTVRVRVR